MGSLYALVFTANMTKAEEESKYFDRPHGQMHVYTPPCALTGASRVMTEVVDPGRFVHLFSGPAPTLGQVKERKGQQNLGERPLQCFEKGE